MIERKNHLIILRFPLVICKQPRLQHEVPHVDERSPDLTAAIPHHPPFVNHLRRHRSAATTEIETNRKWRCRAEAGEGESQLRRDRFRAKRPDESSPAPEIENQRNQRFQWKCIRLIPVRIRNSNCALTVVVVVVVVTLRVGFSGIGDDAIGETTSLQGGTVERERESGEFKRFF